MGPVDVIISGLLQLTMYAAPPTGFRRPRRLSEKMTASGSALMVRRARERGCRSQKKNPSSEWQCCSSEAHGEDGIVRILLLIGDVHVQWDLGRMGCQSANPHQGTAGDRAVEAAQLAGLPMDVPQSQRESDVHAYAVR